MKKILTLLLLATLLLTACNTPAAPIDSETNETTAAPTDAETTTPEDIETTTAPNETTTPEDIETTTPEETETTTPNDTDTTVPDDTDTTQPPDIQDDPPTNLPQKVQSVEVTNSDGEIVTISVDMESSEYNAYSPPSGGMSRCHFHKSTQNQAVLVVRKYAEKNYEIWLFPERPEPTDADFAKLKYGMSLVEVISVVGIPHQLTNNRAIQYFSDSGIMYGLEFEPDSSVDGEYWIEAAYSNILTEDVTALFRPE